MDRFSRAYKAAQGGDFMSNKHTQAKRRSGSWTFKDGQEESRQPNQPTLLEMPNNKSIPFHRLMSSQQVARKFGSPALIKTPQYAVISEHAWNMLILACSLHYGCRSSNTVGAAVCARISLVKDGTIDDCHASDDCVLSWRL